MPHCWQREQELGAEPHLDHGLNFFAAKALATARQVYATERVIVPSERQLHVSKATSETDPVRNRPITFPLHQNTKQVEQASTTCYCLFKPLAPRRALLPRSTFCTASQDLFSHRKTKPK